MRGVKHTSETLRNQILTRHAVNENGCWLWTGRKDRRGYSCIRFENKAHKGHRVSYQLFIGEIPEGMCVCHRCDTLNCVNPYHLFLGTQKDNMRDCLLKGRYANSKGDSNPNHKLTKDQVIFIRKSVQSGVTIRHLEKELNTPYSTIWSICKGRSWQSIR